MPASPESSTTWPSPPWPRPAPQQQLGSRPPARPAPSGPLRCSASKRLSTALARSAAHARVGSGDALELPRPEVLQLEEIAEKLPRAFGDDHRVRLGDALQARREVRRLADDAALLRLPRSDQVADDDQAGGDADAGLQRRVRSRARRPPRSAPARPAPPARRRPRAPADSRSRPARRRPCISRRSHRSGAPFRRRISDRPK